MEEFVIEFVLWVFVAPVLEAILTVIISAIASKWNWHPIKKKFDKTITDATLDAFVMAPNSETKSLSIMVLSFAIFGFVLGIALPIGLYFGGDVTVVGAILMAVIFQAVLLPVLLASLHYTTKKIYFSNNEIVVKSLIYVKKIVFSQIEEVTESLGEPAILTLTIVLKSGKKLIIRYNYGNYDLAKERFIAEGLLKQDTPKLEEEHSMKNVVYYVCKRFMTKDYPEYTDGTDCECEEIVSVDCSLFPYDEQKPYYDKCVLSEKEQVLAVLKVEKKKMLPCLEGFEFCGFDLADGDEFSVGGTSVLTNCPHCFDEEFTFKNLNKYGLLYDRRSAEQLCERLPVKYPDEPHAKCAVYAVWRIKYESDTCPI